MANQFDEMNQELYRYRFIMLATLVVLLVGTVFYHLVEKWKWLDSLYFSVITLTTVGYGDFSPKTDPGKIFTMFYIIVGIGIIGAAIGVITKRAGERRLEKLAKGNAEVHKSVDHITP
jgi:voltage-gated potassium channel